MRKIDAVSLLVTWLCCLTVGFFVMYAGMRIQQHDWLVAWLDLSAATLFLRMAAR